MGRGVGVLLVAGGAALLWLLKKGHRHGIMVHTRNVVIGPKQGVCGVTEQPANVTLKKHERLHWKIRNAGGGPCDGPVEVCMSNWRPFNPLEEDEHGDGRFCRTVRPGQTKTLPARVKPDAREGSYH